MNINNNFNNTNIFPNNSNINNQDTENTVNNFLNQTEEKNTEILSSILDNRDKNSKTFHQEVGNRNIQNLSTTLQASKDSLDKSQVLLKNLKALYLNINSKNFSFDKISNLSEKNSIVIKQLKFLANNTNLNEKSLLSGQPSEFNIFIKNKPQNIKLNLVSLLKIASTLEDLKITNMDSLKDAVNTINKSLEDINRSQKRVVFVHKDIQSAINYYDKNSNSKIKNPNQAKMLLNSLKTTLLGTQETPKPKGSIFKNILNKPTNAPQNMNIKPAENKPLQNTNIDYIPKNVLEQEIDKILNSQPINNTDELVSEDDIEKTTRALRNLTVYDDNEVIEDDNVFKDLSTLLNNKETDKTSPKKEVFQKFDEEFIKNAIAKNEINKSNNLIESNDELKIESIKYKELDKNLIALLNAQNSNKNISKYIWPLIMVVGLTTFGILAMSFMK
ncbi:MAG: hypothetical protein R3Y64_03185 [Peptostreptococcaceae bacterium]